MGNIEKLVVIDQGNGGANRVAQTGPTVVFQFLQQLKALGLDVPTVLEQLGIQKNGGLEAKPEP
jgi:hypothetical protein